MDSQTERAVSVAAGSISDELNQMFSRLPAGADRSEIAYELIYQLQERCDSREFITIFKEALTARHALIELGVDLNAP
jgi:hypothetical protein